MKNALAQVKRRKRVQHLLAVLAALALLWFSLPLLSQVFFAVLTPIWNGFGVVQQIAEEDIGSQFVPRHKLVARNDQLQKKVEELTLSVSVLRADLRSLEREARIATTTDQSSMVLRGAVYAKPPVSPHGTFLVNVGSRSGVDEGEYARVHEDVVVGTVEKVYLYHSLVSLLSRPDRVTPALFETGIQVDITGQGGGALLAHIPLKSDVEIGHLVYATEPTRSVIGVVEALEENTGEGILEVYIRQSVNPNEVTHLLFDITDNDGE